MLKKSLVVITWKPDPASPAEKVLVLQLTPARGGFWQTVTGRVDGSEAFETCALREAGEETGLSFERRPQYLGLEHEFVGKEKTPAVERAFFLPVVGGLEPPTVVIDPTEHTNYQWLTPVEAIALIKFPFNKEAVERATSRLPPLFLSRGGSFFQEGEEITHARTALLLHRSLVKAGENFVVQIDKEELDVVLEDTPRFVRSFDPASGTLTLSNDDTETLDPSTLEIRADNSLVCRLQNGWAALFLSSAYYELTRGVSEDSDGKYLLNFRGRNYLLGIAPKGE